MAFLCNELQGNAVEHFTEKKMDYLIAIFLVVCSTLLTLAVQRSTGKSTKNKEIILE